jgi:hypothetical protein
LEKAKQYRDRAEELRTIAQDWIDDRAQKRLLDLAHEYEQMAEQRERQFASQTSAPMPRGQIS